MKSKNQFTRTLPRHSNRRDQTEPLLSGGDTVGWGTKRHVRSFNESINDNSRRRMKTPFTIARLLFGLSVVATFFFNDVKAATVFPIATNSSREYGFSFAFDGTNYLVGIWGDETAPTNSYRNVTAQLVSRTGALVGPRIGVGRTGDIPAVAFDGTNYLLIWKDSTEDLYGQRVSPSGALVGSAFAISTAPGDQKPKSLFDKSSMTFPSGPT